MVFYGTMDGWFKAANARTAAELWKFHTGSGMVGNPITLSVVETRAAPMQNRRIAHPDSRNTFAPHQLTPLAVPLLQQLAYEKREAAVICESTNAPASK